MELNSRDRRRRLSRAEAAELYAGADGRCQRCGQALGVNWQQAHLVAYSHAGATTLDQMEAWCRECNLRQGAKDAVSHPALKPRLWQARALDVVLERIWSTGVATVHAAPGAGKTFLAGLVFRQLADAGLVSRLVVVVPNRALQRQWADALGTMGIHLDWRPRDNFHELKNTLGVVVTYQSLDSAAAGHIQRMNEPTLLVLDEVHHVGENKAWGLAVSRIVGDLPGGDSLRPAGVLNMTGTLFRSTGEQRIGSVRYDRIVDNGIEKYQAVADFSVKASELIGVELRPPDLYAYGGQVELVDVRHEQVVAGDIADLAEGPQVSTAIREGFMKRALVREFAREAMTLLSRQLATLQDHEPLKLLWVAENRAAARLAAEEIDKVAGRRFARLVISDEPGALDTLRQAIHDKHSCAIVAVKMVTEGFDCPQVSVIAYASATTAVLFLAQTMARAMRVTITERRDKQLLPAMILIPDNRNLREAFAKALVGHFHVLEVPEEPTSVVDTETGVQSDLVRLPRYQLADMSSIDLRSATVLGEEDGLVLADELREALHLCLEVQIPEVYAPRLVVAARRLTPRLPLYTKTVSEPATTAGTAVLERPADPRSLNLARRKRLDTLTRWMNYHIEHDQRFASLAVFVSMGNEAAGMASGGRKDATPEQLERCEDWMVTRIREHCSTNGCKPPSLIRRG